jgi:hypothetical protein
MLNGVNHVDKPDFLQAYCAARTEAMSLANIQSSFAATGLVPYDPKRVLLKLHPQLKTPASPSSSHEQWPWVPETPHNIAQLELQTKTIKEYLQRRTKRPPTPTNHALNQLVKGCQIAMNSAVLLAEENRQLRAENQRQKKKRAQKRTFIARGGVLTLQDRLDQSQPANIEPESGVASQEATVRTRAPRTCSICGSKSHTARTCQMK